MSKDLYPKFMQLQEIPIEWGFDRNWSAVEQVKSEKTCEESTEKTVDLQPKFAVEHEIFTEIPRVHEIPPSPQNSDEEIPRLNFSDDEDFAQSSGSYPFELNWENNESRDSRYGEIHDQLMSVVMENERLASELEHVKYDEIENLSDQLRAEREKNRLLQDQLRPKSVTPRRRKIAQSRRDILYKSRSMVNLSRNSNVDIADGLNSDSEFELAEDALMNTEDIAIGKTRFLRNQFIMKVKTWLTMKYEELLNDFLEVNNVIETPAKEGDQLNPFKLKNNLIRVGNFLDPLEEIRHSLLAIMRWENPAISLLAFTIYMVVIYKDWILVALSFCIVSTFFFTYLRHKGWSFGTEVESINNYRNNETEKDVGVRDQISILINVGRRSQNHAGLASDIFEKIKNLILWREPELTQPVVILCCMAFVGTLIFPPNFILKMAGLAIGIQIFILQYIFMRFPRINKKYNKIEEFIAQLKTDAQYENAIKKIKKDLKKTPKLSRSVSSVQVPSNATNLSSTSQSSTLTLAGATTSEPTEIIPTSFHDIFQLPISEIPLSAWSNGRRCFLVNKEKTFSTGFKLGRLYLTNNYLCYERYKAVSDKNVIIPLETITKVSKAKLYHWVPGGGKSIEIKLKNNRKTLLFVFQTIIFGPIINRDEAYDSIMGIGLNNDYAWANTNEIDS